MSQQKVPYVYFDRFEICALSKRQINKLSNDNKFIKIEQLLLKIYEKGGIFFLLFNRLFCPISQNMPGRRHKVPFVMMCHIHVCI